MAINIVELSVQYNSGFLPDILLLTQEREMVSETFYCILFCFVWRSSIAINNNVNVQYNGGFLLDIILLTQGYYQRGTLLNAMKSFFLSFVAYETAILNTWWKVPTDLSLVVKRK